MAAGGNKYLSDKSNPFFSAEEVDDDAFLSRRPGGGGGGRDYMFSDHLTTEERKLEQQRQELIAKKEEIERRTLESTFRSVALIDDSERVGTETAEVSFLWKETVCFHS
jgi:hypothetical protein